MALAKDIMTPKPLTLQSGMSIKEAVEFFTEQNITSAPVETPLGEILGLFEEMDLIKAFVRHQAEGSRYSKVIHAQAEFDPVSFVADEDPVTVVLKSLMRNPTHRVLVRDRQERLVGIISPKDILHSLSGKKAVPAKPLVDELNKLQQEIDGLKTKLKEMTLYLQTYDSVFQSGLYMLHSADREGKIIVANERLHQALGYDPGELIGQSIYDIYPPSVHSEARAGLKRVMKEGQHQLTYSSMVTKKGEVKRVELASAALRDEEGRFLGTFTISREYGSENMLRSLHGLFKEGSNKEDTSGEGPIKEENEN